MTYDVGDRVRVTATFTDEITGAPMDPSVITLTIRPPRLPSILHQYGNPSSAIVRQALGVYYIDQDITVHGSWYYRWSGSGALVAAEESHFFVRVSSV